MNRLLEKTEKLLGLQFEFRREHSTIENMAYFLNSIDAVFIDIVYDNNFTSKHLPIELNHNRGKQ